MVLHKEKLQLTIATVPNAPGFPGKSAFSHWLYADWRGAFDLKALAQSADLICLMTYDQNTRWTMPGPVAGYPWTVENLEFALQFVPKKSCLKSKSPVRLSLVRRRTQPGQESRIQPPNTLASKRSTNTWLPIIRM